MNTEIKYLRKIRKIIEKGWCKRYQAIDRFGNEVSVIDRKAVSYCLLGALAKVDPDDTFLLSDIMRDQLPEGRFSLAAFNDDVYTTKEDVLALIDRAMENC